MLYLLDTNAITDGINKHPRFTARLAAISKDDQICTCSIVLGEIAFGIQKLLPGRSRTALQEAVRIFLKSILHEAVPVAAADYYAQLKQARRQAGTSMDENDLWIAATTMALGAVLVTRDQDFQSSPRLILEDWTK